MALAAKRDARMDVSEFRLWLESRPAHGRGDLLDGEPAHMAPRERHRRIVMNVAGRVEAWRREGDDSSVAALGLDGTVPLRDLYRGLAF